MLLHEKPFLPSTGAIFIFSSDGIGESQHQLT